MYLSVKKQAVQGSPTQTDEIDRLVIEIVFVRAETQKCAAYSRLN